MNKADQLSLRAYLAITGQALLLASAWLFPMVLGYELQSDYISEQALGRYGFLQNVAFSVGGVGIVAIAFAPNRTAFEPGLLMKIGGALCAIWGLALMLVVFWPTDPIDSAADLARLSSSGTIHAALAGVATLSAVAGLVVMSWAFSRDAGWRAKTTYSALLATASVSLLFAQQYGPRVGLMQRMLITVLALWVIAVAWHVLALARRQASD